MPQIKISTDEYAALIRETASNRQALSGALGGYVNTDESPWVVPLLAEWRGVAFNEGAGI